MASRTKNLGTVDLFVIGGGINGCGVARDAQDRGAKIQTRTKVAPAERDSDLWKITTEGRAAGQAATTRAKMLVNAGGPWVEDIIRNTARIDTTEGVRLVRGSHIVTKKLFDNDKSYFFQSEDGRVSFTIPCEIDFTLIGTTDADHDDPPEKPESTPEEAAYLCRFASNYFMKPIMQDDIVWTCSGVRPLYNGGAKSATAATRDYLVKVDQTGGAPLLNVFGGMITTYRRLAEHALAKIAPFFSGTSGDRTAGVALPGGDFPVSGVQRLIEKLKTDFSFLGDFRARRLIRAYGTDA